MAERGKEMSKKAIEEMARTMCKPFDVNMTGQPCTKCRTYNSNCYTIHNAEILYNAGYRKVVQNPKKVTALAQLLAKEFFADKIKERILACKDICNNCCGEVFQCIDAVLKEAKDEYRRSKK